MHFGSTVDRVLFGWKKCSSVNFSHSLLFIAWSYHMHVLTLDCWTYFIIVAMEYHQKLINDKISQSTVHIKHYHLPSSVGCMHLRSTHDCSSTSMHSLKVLYSIRPMLWGLWGRKVERVKEWPELLHIILWQLCLRAWHPLPLLKLGSKLLQPLIHFAVDGFQLLSKLSVTPLPDAITPFASCSEEKNKEKINVG